MILLVEFVNIARDEGLEIDMQRHENRDEITIIMTKDSFIKEEAFRNTCDNIGARIDEFFKIEYNYFKNIRTLFGREGLAYCIGIWCMDN
jgi:hypothetical protein